MFNKLIGNKSWPNHKSISFMPMQYERPGSIMNGLSISRLHAMPLYQESGDIPAQSSPLVVVGVGPDRVLTIWDDEAYGWTYDTFYTLNGRDSIICSGSCIGDSNFVMIVNETRQLDCYDCQLFE